MLVDAKNLKITINQIIYFQGKTKIKNSNKSEISIKY